MICKKDILALRQSISEFVSAFATYRPQISVSQVKEYIAYFFDCLDYEELEEYTLKKDSIFSMESSFNVKKVLIDNFMKYTKEFSVLELENILAFVDFTDFTWFKFSLKNTDAEIAQFTKRHQIKIRTINKNFLLEIKQGNKVYCGVIGRIFNKALFEHNRNILYFQQLGQVSYGKILTNTSDSLEAVPYFAMFFEKNVVSRVLYDQLFLVFEACVDFSIQTQMNLLKHWFPHQPNFSLLSKKENQALNLYSIKIMPATQDAHFDLFKDLTSDFRKIDFKDNFSIIFHTATYVQQLSSGQLISLSEANMIASTYNVSVEASSYNQIILKRYLETIMTNKKLQLSEEKVHIFSDRLFKSVLNQRFVSKYSLFHEQLEQTYLELIKDSIWVKVSNNSVVIENQYKESMPLTFKGVKDNYLLIGNSAFVYNMLNKMELPLKLINFKRYYTHLLSENIRLSYTDKNKLMKSSILESISLNNKLLTKSFFIEYLSYLNYQYKLKLDIGEFQSKFEQITYDNQLIFIEYVNLIEDIQLNAKILPIEMNLVMFIENYELTLTDSKLGNSLLFLYLLFQILNEEEQSFWVLNNIQELNLLNYIELIEMLFRYRAKLFNKPYLCFIYEALNEAIEHNVTHYIFKSLIGTIQEVEDRLFVTNHTLSKMILPSKELLHNEQYHYVLYTHDHHYDYIYVKKEI